MQMRAMGPGAGWRWLVRGVNLGRHNARAVFGGTGLLIAVALVPTLIQLIVQVALKNTSQGAMYALGAFSLLFSLLVVMPLVAGMLRVIHASENGRATHATAIFEVFKPGGGIGRIVAVSVALAVLAAAVIGLIVSVVDPGVAQWYVQAMVASRNLETGAAAPNLPPLPEGIGMVVGLLILFGLFMQGFHAIAFGQIALTDRSVGGALADGFVGALKNLLPLLVLLVCFAIGAVLSLIVIALLVGLMVAIGSLVDPMLGMALAAPVYLAFLLVLYVVIFGVMYHLWRDVTGAGAAPSAPADKSGVVAA